MRGEIPRAGEGALGEEDDGAVVDGICDPARAEPASPAIGSGRNAVFGALAHNTDAIAPALAWRQNRLASGALFGGR